MNTQDLSRSFAPIRHRKHAARRGNLLVGCGVVLVVVIVLLVIGGIFVAMNVRGWTAGWGTNMVDTVLTEAQIDPVEHKEIMAHVESLMTRFEDGEIEWNQLGKVADELMQSPVVPAAMVMAIDSLYISGSELEDAEKMQARTDLARYAQGLFDESISPNTVDDVLEPVITHTPDENDIRLNLQIDKNGTSVTALKSADDVTTEELRTLISNAKAQADEVGVTETPEPIDLSDELAKAIGIALGEIQDDSVSDEIEEPANEPAVDDGP